MRAIDCLINLDMGDYPPHEWLQRVKQDYFHAGPEMLENTPIDAVIDEMDRLGIAKAIILSPIGSTASPAIQAVSKAPDRFSLGLTNLDYLRPMPTVKLLEATTKDFPVSYVICGTAFWGDGLYPPDDAVYYPLYTKACELDLPVCMATGLPGPPVPGNAQNPMYLDRVCYRFPELKLCMNHGADPWWDVAIRLMIKYKNLHLMTSAWAPKYLPESLLHFMRTRGKTKIMFASDAPVLTMTRTLTEAQALDLPEDVMENYLYRNAENFFFGTDAAATEE